ncbi:MAG: rhodanese-like domain-containing protein [candidate division Zixibacteria bacterium]
MMKNWIIQILIILLLSAVLAVGINSIRDDGISFIGNWPSRTAEAGEMILPPSAEEGDPPFISLDEAVALYQSTDNIFIDARDPEDFEYAHIKRAINIPFDYLDEHWEQVIAEMDKTAHYVIYCSGTECESSLFLGRYFRDEDFVNSKIFYGGWGEWETNNLPIEAKSSEGENQ